MPPFDSRFVTLVCPRRRSALRAATEAEVEAVNAAVRAGSARSADGEGVAVAVDGGLVRDGSDAVLYPVRGGIPILIADEAIVL